MSTNMENRRNEGSFLNDFNVTADMPYNTRHKSLSLSSLGIHVPVTYAERAAAKSAPKDTTFPNRASDSVPHGHPNKRFKRSHQKEHGAPIYFRSSVEGPGQLKVRTNRHAVRHDHTPPRSPNRAPSESRDDVTQPVTRKVDIEGINDHVVEAVIARLEMTANRPHLVNELATVLSQILANVEESANPSAIISSRLAAYMKRPYWSALAPCPIAKKVPTGHPRRTYFYLTTCPHLCIPDLPQDALSQTFISPSVSDSSSSGSLSGAEDDGCNYRRELSPSPDVDLSPTAFDDQSNDTPSPVTPIGSLPYISSMSRCQRSASPPLEKDEREFTQTADGLHKRKLTSEVLAGGYSEQLHMEDMLRDDAVFDDKQSPAPGTGFSITFTASPAVRASFPLSYYKKDIEVDHWPNIGKLLEWDPNPEDIELDELDCLLETC